MALPHFLLNAVKYVAAGGGIFLIKFIFLYFVYVSLRYFLRKKEDKKDARETVGKNEKIFRTSLLLIGVLMAALFFLGIAVDFVNHSPGSAEVAKNSAQLLESDRMIFGVYPSIWFHQSTNSVKPYLDMVARPIIESYAQLGVLIALLLLGALAYNQALLWRIALAFLLSVVVSLPLWYLFPVITPNETFYSNKLHSALNNEVTEAMETFSPIPYTERILNNIATNRETGKNGYFGITTIPSMHITWSVFVLYFGILLWRKSAYYLVPYFFVNAFSTMYLLQHYFLDIVGGIIVGIFVITLTGHVMPRVPGALFIAGEALRSDISQLVGRLQNIYVRIKK